MQTASVVVPCFNEQTVLPELFERLSAAAAAAGGVDYEVNGVDGGSRCRRHKAFNQYP